MNIQDEANKIIKQFGVSEMAFYKIQLLCEAYAAEVSKDKTPLVVATVSGGFITHVVTNCPINMVVYDEDINKVEDMIFTYAVDNTDISKGLAGHTAEEELLEYITSENLL